MNFIWLTSSSGATADFARDREDLVATDSAENCVFMAGRDHYGAVIVEVKDSNDAGRAVEVIDELRGALPVWIYQPEATVRSTVSLIKAGASQIVNTPGDLDEAMNSIPGASAPVAPVGRALIGRSRSIQ